MPDFWLHWLSEAPELIICSFKAYSILGDTLFGYLPLHPDPLCEDFHLYAIRFPDTEIKFHGKAS